MNGMTTTTFGPEVILNRAMLVTILYRMSGSTGVNYFDLKFFEYYEMGYSVEMAFDKAYKYFDEDELLDYNIDSARLLVGS